MTDRHWIEAELIVRTANGAEARQQFEFDRSSRQLEDVPDEILDHLDKAVGSERVRLIDQDR